MGKGRTAGHGQDRAQTAPGRRGKGRVETPNHHIQGCVALVSPAHPTPGQRSPKSPRQLSSSSSKGGHQPRGSEALPQGWPGFQPPGLGMFWFVRCHEALGAEQPLPWHRGGCTTVSHPPQLSHGHLRVLSQCLVQLQVRTSRTGTQQRMKNVSWVKEQKFGYPGGHLVKEEEEEEQGFGAVLLSP